MFLFAGITFALFWLRRNWRSISWIEIGIGILILLLPWAIWAITQVVTSPVSGGLAAAGHSISGKLWHLFPWLAMLIIVVAAFIAGAKRKIQDESGVTFALLLLFAALMLTMGVELFYVVDVFDNRMNTVFRLYYQAWAMLAIVMAFGIYYLGRHWRPKAVWARLGHFLWWGLLIVLLAVSVSYPVAAAWSRTHESTNARTLDGLAFVSLKEREAINFLWTVPGDSVIVEAIGTAYSNYGRVSSRTGLATILGWPNHEMVWRGSADVYKGRPEDVDQIYTSKDATVVKGLLQKYGVSYVYVGDLEKGKYGPDVVARLATFMNKAFDNGDVTIFQVR